MPIKRIAFPAALSLFLLVSGASVSAQDRIQTVNDDIFSVKVFEVTKDIVRIEPITTEYTVIKQFACNYVKSITFADGFNVAFTSEGVPVRDNFLAAPKLTARTNGIYAEGLFRLNQDETVTLLGESKYNLFYRPAQARFYTGAAQSLVGGVSILGLLFIDKKDIIIQDGNAGVEFKGMDILGLSGLENAPHKLKFKGSLNPFIVSAELFGTSAVICGVFNFIKAGSDLKRALIPDISLPSLQSCRRAYWTGLSLAVAGLGAIAAGTVDMASKSEWNWSRWEGSSYERYNIQEGNYPIAGPLLSLAGSIAFNIGLSTFITAITKFKFSGQDRNLSAVSLNYGLTPYGYGLNLTF